MQNIDFLRLLLYNIDITGRGGKRMETIRAEIFSEISVEFAASSVNMAMPAMHYHNAYEIYILEKGSRTYLINDALTELRAHDIALIPPNEIHSTAGGGFTRHLISFREDYLRRYFTEEAQKKLLICFEHKKIHIKNADFEKLLRLTRELKHSNDNFVVFAQILSLIAQNASTDASFVSSKNKMLSEIIEYIGSHYDRISGLEEISEKFFISKSYLCRLFKEHTGISVVKYIHLLKIQSACDLLLETNKSVEEIAQKCGFHTSMYFCRTFKSIVGMTPTQYRCAND